MGLHFWSSVLSSAERSGARIEGCGLAKTRPVSRILFDRPFDKPFGKLRTWLRMQLRTRLRYAFASLRLLRCGLQDIALNLPRLCLATHPYVGYNSIHHKT